MIGKEDKISQVKFTEEYKNVKGKKNVIDRMHP
jgi:hypothetical protein